MGLLKREESITWPAWTRGHCGFFSITRETPPLSGLVGSEILKILPNFPEILPVNNLESCPGRGDKLKLNG